MPSADEISRWANPHSHSALSSLPTVLCEVRWSAFFARSHKSVMVTGSVGSQEDSQDGPMILAEVQPCATHVGQNLHLLVGCFDSWRP
jgi:hypothetical protein